MKYNMNIEKEIDESDNFVISRDKTAEELMASGDCDLYYAAICSGFSLLIWKKVLNIDSTKKMLSMFINTNEYACFLKKIIEYKKKQKIKINIV